MNISETITENIFRNFYGPTTFIEKNAIPKEIGFKSKKKTDYKGYPDFFMECKDYCIVVEAKATKHIEAENEVKFYMLNNKILNKDIIGIAISGQDESQIKVTYYYKLKDKPEIDSFKFKDILLSLEALEKKFYKHKCGEFISDEELVKILKNLNKTFNDNNIRDTERSLFFSGLMIALTNSNFRSTYKNIEAPTKEELAQTKIVVLGSHNLNMAVLEAITKQLKSKINNLSKEFSWKDKFSFIKNVDFPLKKYKEIISIIEEKIYAPYILDEKQDLLGKAYKIFLSRAGKIDNKNIILTPDHIKELMIKLARLTVDDVVLDTCTGSGGFLMEAMEKIISLAKDDDEKINQIKENQLIGFEIDSVLFSLACSNMFLHGDGRTNLLYRSSLLKTSKENMINSTDSDLLKFIKSKKPTKCIINPPYENNNSILFTKQALEYLEPNGKLIIIMPTPTLTKYQGPGGMTHDILGMAKLDFVIKMPNKLFSEQKRQVNTSIFGFTKTPHNKDDLVLFYNMSDDGLVSIQHKGRVDLYNKWNTIESEVLYAINNSLEIENVCEKRKIYNGDILFSTGVQNKRESSYKLEKIRDIFTTQKGTLQSSKGNPEGEFDFITASSEWGKHDEYAEDCEALVYAVQAAGSLGRSHYVNGKFIASNLCLILKLKKDCKHYINLEFYNQYFNTIREKIVSDLADGGSKLVISEEVFLDYYIEIIPKEIQDSYVKNNIINVQKLKKRLKEEEENLNKFMLELL